MRTRRFPPMSGLVLAALAGCGNGTPAWIKEPVVEGGLVATECVPDNGNLSLDRQVAVARARGDVSRQYDARIAAMERAWQSLARSEPAAREPASTFAAVAQQVAGPTLAELSPTRVEYIEIDDVPSLCAQVALERAQARLLFEAVIETSGREVDVAAIDALYRAFAGEVRAAAETR